jgi:hypothetical protein
MTQPTFTGASLPALRAATHLFISMDPSAITLVPKVQVLQPSGGFTEQDAVSRPLQQFKLIARSAAERPFEAGPDAGLQRTHDFILLGEWDAVMAVGDHWIDASGTRYEIVALVPYNGYETRAVVTADGK